MTQQGKTNTIHYVDASAPDVETAIEKGLAELGLSRNDVIIEVIHEGGPGLFGLGARDAQVRLTALREPQPSAATASSAARKAAPGSVMDGDEAGYAGQVLQDILIHMGYQGVSIAVDKIGPEEDPEEQLWLLDISGDDMTELIGRRGETLEALQYITRMIVSREVKAHTNIIVDVEGYKTRREDALRRLAERMAAQARKQARVVVLEPMPANERRIIHMALRSDKSVVTESIGSGEKRKVTIRPV